MSLADQQCRPVSPDDTRLAPQQIETYLRELDDTWSLDHHQAIIRREFLFRDYHETIEFINKVADIIHPQDHHPEITISYNRCIIEFTTHSIQNLSINDFICAAKINQIINQISQ